MVSLVFEHLFTFLKVKDGQVFRKVVREKLRNFDVCRVASRLEIVAFKRNAHQKKCPQR